MHAQVLPQTGMPKSVSPALIKVAPMAQTAMQPRSAMHSPPSTAIDIKGLNWTQIPGAASQVAVAPDGSIWALSTQPSGSDKYIWNYAGGTWTNIAGLASQLAVGPNGILYAINSGGGTYAYDGINWTALGGGASGIAAAADGSIYVLSNGGAGPDRAIWHNVNGTWSQVPGSGVSLEGSFDTSSYVTPGGTVSAGGLYIVNSQGSIYYENPGGGFAQLPANASALAPATVGGVFALGYPANAGGNTIYYYNLTTPGWSTQSGAGVSMSSGAGELYVVGASGAIYSSPVTTTLKVSYYPIPTASSYPFGIALGPDGNMWFAESVGNKIGKITTAGSITEFSAGLPANSQPEKLISGPDGNVWFTGYWNGCACLGRIAPSGTISTFAYPQGGCQPYPYDLTVGPDGNIWVTDGACSSVAVVNTNSPGGTWGGYSNLPANPWGIASGSDGNLWFTNYNQYGYNNPAIGKLTTSGSVTLYPISGLGNGYPDAIVAGPDRNLWFTISGYAAIGTMTTAGVVTTYPIPSGAYATDIAVGANGTLWFTEYGSAKIGNITTTGVVAEYTLPPNPSLPAGSSPSLEGLAVDGSGNLWFTDSNSNTIGEFAL
ncbi:MAG: virginiamycin B lyase family protein [Vulcanimicrobiaceae bacterium]